MFVSLIQGMLLFHQFTQTVCGVFSFLFFKKICIFVWHCCRSFPGGVEWWSWSNISGLWFLKFSLYSLNLFPLIFELNAFTFYWYVNCSTTLKYKHFSAIFQDFFIFSVFPIRCLYAKIKKNLIDGNPPFIIRLIIWLKKVQIHATEPKILYL